MIGRLIRVLIRAMVATSLATTAAANPDTAAIARWDFDVFLGDKKLGRHTFEVVEEDGVKRVVSEADFVYKVLFVPAYRYEHSNAERWADDCLLEFEARTNDNGKKIRAFGERSGNRFAVVGEGGPEDLPACVMTFAYWNPAFLEQRRLLNPQSGEYMEIQVERLPQQMLEVRGKNVPAQPFRLTAEDLEVTVWYSIDERWLGLESVADGGKILRYELA